MNNDISEETLNSVAAILNEMNKDTSAAKLLHNVYVDFVTAGFTPDQAFALIMTLLERSLK